MYNEFPTDVQIVGQLRQKTKAVPVIDNITLTANEWDKYKEEIMLQNSLEDNSILKSEVTLYHRKPSEQHRKRVPRLWWGWTMILYQWCKKERTDLIFMAKGLGFAVTMTILIICLSVL